MARPERTVYGVYRGDEFVTVGTASECSRELNMKISNFRILATPSYTERRVEDGDSLFVFALDNEEDDGT